MNQQKIGSFLKELRKEQGFTQEELGEHFYVTSRTVSRWETGYHLPDVDTLMKLADFYENDIREIIDGERKSDSMDHENRDTLKRVAEYAAEESIKRGERLRNLLAGAVCLMQVSYLPFGSAYKGRLNGVIPEHVCAAVMSFVIGAAAASWMV